MNEVGTIAVTHGWGGLKWYAAHVTGISEDALHIHAGMIILLVASLLWRRVLWHWRPWLTVVVAEVVNESIDLLQHGGREATLAASAHDVWMTLLWPTAILMVAPRLARRSSKAQPAV